MKDFSGNRVCLLNDASQKFLLKVVSSPKAEFMNGLVQHLAIRLVRLVRHVTEDARKDEELRELNRRFEE